MDIEVQALAQSSAIVEFHAREKTLRLKAARHRRQAEEFDESRRVELELAQENERLANEYAAVILREQAT